MTTTTKAVNAIAILGGISLAAGVLNIGLMVVVYKRQQSQSQSQSQLQPCVEELQPQWLKPTCTTDTDCQQKFGEGLNSVIKEKLREVTFL